MMQALLIPPLAFFIYLILCGVLLMIGRVMAGADHATSTLKSSTYASGESQSQTGGAPGYRPFFLVALFFAVLHLGVLVLASGALTPLSAVYLIGLIFALIALILG